MSIVLSVVAIVLTSVAGHPWLGIFFALGLALGAINNRMLQMSVLKLGNAEKPIAKGSFRRSVFARLTIVTVIAIALALLVRPDGLGVFAGLAVFQVLMLVGAALPVFRSLRPSA